MSALNSSTLITFVAKDGLLQQKHKSPETEKAPRPTIPAGEPSSVSHVYRTSIAELGREFVGDASGPQRKCWTVARREG